MKNLNDFNLMYFFFWGDFLEFESYVPTFWKNLFHLHRLGEQEKQIGKDCQNIFTGKVSVENIPAPQAEACSKVSMYGRNGPVSERGR
jgi:hypothetical protein